LKGSGGCVGLLFLFLFLNCSKGKEGLKAQFYRDALEKIPEKYRRVKILVLYNELFQDEKGNICDLRVNSSEGALNAYREGIDNPYFVGTIDNGVTPSAAESTCYLGVFSGWGELEDSITSSKIEEFEELVDKGVAFVPFSNFWGENYASDRQLNEIDHYGAIPMLRMMPWRNYWESGYDSLYSLQRIIDGEFDSLLLAWADVIKGYKKPVMITFGVEMNGDWFPWSGVFQGGGRTEGYGDPTKPDGPERYVDAYRHIVDLFRENGVTNAIWYFHVNHTSHPDESWNEIENYYPGDDYVDWVGFSLYGKQYPDEEWLTFEEVMDPIYQTMTTLFPDKPLLIPEWGVREE